MMRAAAPPASPWRASPNARPLVCWRDAQLRALAEAMNRSLASWCAEWGVRSAGAVACCAAEHPGESPSWRVLRLGAEPAGWLHVPDASIAALRMALFAGSDAAGPAATATTAACEQDALRRLLSVLGLGISSGLAAGPDPADLQPWSGLVQAQLPPPLHWQWLLQPTAMRAWCATQVPAGPAPTPPKYAALASVIDAAGSLPARLGVQLAGCELDLATLQGLRPGDVLRLQHRIDAPATVTDRAGQPLFSGYLGRSAGARAVELAALRPPEPPPVSHQDLP